MRTGCSGVAALPHVGPADGEWLLESFHGKFRDECLNENWFLDLTDARRKIRDWKWDYDESRPHRAGEEASPALNTGRSHRERSSTVTLNMSKIVLNTLLNMERFLYRSPRAVFVGPWLHSISIATNHP
jgi:hypothetical protein